MQKQNGILSFLIVFCLILTGYSQASIVMTGTRVIFPSGLNEKMIQFTNSDPQPYIMQLQLTTVDNQPAPQAPFILLPPVFRMEPYSGQTIRLISNGTATLPQNRESVFYLNFTQLPSIKADLQGKNHLMIAITSRVKIFYRPNSLSGDPVDAYKELHFSLLPGTLEVTNPTGFYINISSAQIVVSGKAMHVSGSTMLAPLSTEEWHLEKKITSLNGTSIRLALVNDYGADITKEKPLESH
ncbi:TPA: molecular chaperone [Escherichia coli]|nr:molecular chaperone [Escherichia coli]